MWLENSNDFKWSKHWKHWYWLWLIRLFVMEVIFVILVITSKNLWRQKRGVERTKNTKEHRVLKVPGGLSFVYSLVRSVSKLSCFEFRLKTRNFSRLKLSSRKTFEKPLKKRDVKKRFFIFFLLRFLLWQFGLERIVTSPQQKAMVNGHSLHKNNRESNT